MIAARSAALAARNRARSLRPERMTEPGAGSDVPAIATTARRED